MVAGELFMVIRHKGHLVYRQVLRHQLAHHVHQVMQGVAFNVELALWPGLHQAGQFGHIVGTNMALVRAWMHGNAVGPGLQA